MALLLYCFPQKQQHHTVIATPLAAAPRKLCTVFIQIMPQTIFMDAYRASAAHTKHLTAVCCIMLQAL
jgi:hypothetical protein